MCLLAETRITAPGPESVRDEDLGGLGEVLMLLESFAHGSGAKQDMGGAWEG